MHPANGEAQAGLYCFGHQLIPLGFLSFSFNSLYSRGFHVAYNEVSTTYFPPNACPVPFSIVPSQVYVFFL